MTTRQRVATRALEAGGGADPPEEIEHPSSRRALVELGTGAGAPEKIGDVREVARPPRQQLEDDEVIERNDGDLQALAQTEADGAGEHLVLPRAAGADHIQLGTGVATEPEEQWDRIVRGPPTPFGFEAGGPKGPVQLGRGAHVSQEVDVLRRPWGSPGGHRQTAH